MVRIQNQNNWEERRDISISQQGFDYAITLESPQVNIANYAALGARTFDVRVKTNVDFDIEIPVSSLKVQLCSFRQSKNA